ncbi:MAG: hypothetical protein KBD78_15160 [Oligoflexales bacterium]|jgi:hypothetical protein|nr:hypothetical protein [Oligoflexales bacterium]
MAAYQGIQDTKKDILGQNKIQKVKFEDRIESMEPQHIEIKNDIDEKTQNNKQLKNKTDKKINSLNVKSLERRKASKNQVTAYLLDEELEKLEELYFHRRKNKIKTDRSSIIGEAIESFYNKTIKQS